MATMTATEPTYLRLLSLISVAESHAGIYLKAWADVTPDSELRDALTFVAGREASHGEVFRQRIQRLGCCVQEQEGEEEKFAEQMRIYGDPAISDLEKIRYGRAALEPGKLDPEFYTIDDRINDESVDSLTRDTLRWYIHEERDSGELLRPVYARLTAASGAAHNGHAAGVSADTSAIMECMTQGFAALQQSLKELAEGLSKPARTR
ncbi:MAG TPA: hypothetical protein VH916_06505 [Dehalococcoidia bacterium]|jgi:hypothetical protein